MPILAVLLGTAGRLGAQACQAPTSTGGYEAGLVTPGSSADDAMRRASLSGQCRPSLIRSTLTLSPAAPRGFSVAPPSAAMTWNSAIPVTFNDGSLWAGRGMNLLVSGGMRWDAPRLRAWFVPEIAISQNLGFPILASTNPERSSFASPWHELPMSADLPLRFGTAAFGQVSPGQTTVELHSDRIAGGFTTEDQWWGPGIRNAIVVSNNAAGVPRVYVRTERPVNTWLGQLEARLELGQLSKSPFFDDLPTGRRSLSTAIISLRTAFDTGLTVGTARAVYAPIGGTSSLPLHFADVLWRWNQNPVLARQRFAGSNQIHSLFFQWIIPESSVEVYTEWARLVPFQSIAEVVVRPFRTQGYTVGLQWLGTRGAGAIRIQGEATMLEQTPPSPQADVPTFYTSNVAPEGYTQRGQTIGASIGPGGSSQFVALDYLRGDNSMGVELGRIRWEDEAYYRQPTGFASYRHHDVSLFAGVRGSLRQRAIAWTTELLFTRRNNFLFQSNDPVEYDSAFDVSNLTLKLVAVPLRRRPQRIDRPAR